MTSFTVVTERTPIAAEYFKSIADSDYFTEGLRGSMQTKTKGQFLHHEFQQINPITDHILMFAGLLLVSALIPYFIGMPTLAYVSAGFAAAMALFWLLMKSPLTYYLLITLGARKAGYKGFLKLRWSVDGVGDA